MRSAIMITIGDEILIGQTIDTNSAWMGKELEDMGIPLIEIVTVADQFDTIQNAIDQALKKADLVIQRVAWVQRRMT